MEYVYMDIFIAYTVATICGYFIKAIHANRVHI